MPSSKNTGTRDFPLQIAKKLTNMVNDSFVNGELLSKVTPITRDLLRFWFSETFSDIRKFNFHAGQRQAILNTVFVHEILKSKNVFDMYNLVDEDTLSEMGIGEISATKYNYPKYCMKMATGTGKTWVMHALLIWQYLNAKYEETPSGDYSKNFLLVAPGLIVYERLLDAYLGKENEDGSRDFETSDFYKYQELFIPDGYKNTLFSFIQNNVVKKDEIGIKVVGDGMVAITNWHLLAGEDEEVEESDDPFENPIAVVKDLLPIVPGTTAGHTLESLDNKYFRGNELEYLANLTDIVVINDEAHHIHEVKTAGQVSEVEWQKSLEQIADKKGSIPQTEWQSIKRILFNIDSHAKPKVVVSVLMLREGFDVNNICVIVPLRSSEAPILLEQIVGRGLRLMWRGEDYDEIKAENRERLLIKKQEPSNYFDILSIVEHPAFSKFYDDLIKDGIVGETSEMGNDRGSILGDIVEVSLKDNYREYDLFFPIIVQDKEEILVDKGISIDNLQPFMTFSFNQLKNFTKNVGDTFYSDEITVHTRFGNYKVEEGVFNAKSYNEFISKIVAALSASLEKTGVRKLERFPFMQINSAKLAAIIDAYIHTRLFGRNFNPLEDGNWRVLLLRNAPIVDHIIKEISKAIYEMQNNIMVKEAVVLKRYFSEVKEMKVRENYCVPVAKSIYNVLPYPSNKGIYEKDFIEFFDSDSAVDSLIKIKENYHDFAYISYIRKDGLISRYYPDFMVKIGADIYLVETKAEKDTDNVNVIAKKRSALEWVKKINELNSEERMYCQWHYSLVSDSLFYQFRANGANSKEILDFAQIRKVDTIEGQIELFDIDV
jgi:hypothetical protein